MIKSIGLSLAFLLAMVFSGVAASAQKGQSDPAAGGAAAAKREQDYLSTLKRCESMTGAAKSQCIYAARKSYGQL